MAKGKKLITEQEYLEANKRLNELGGEKQTNFKRDIIKSILTEVNSQEDPIIGGMILYYRTVHDHPFRGANRRTAAVVTGIILDRHKIHFKFPSVDELQTLNQKIRDGRISREEFEEIYMHKILNKN